MPPQHLASETTAASPRTFTPIARLEELHGNGPFAFAGGGVDVVVVRTRAGLRAYEGRCPHQGALLGEGELQGETLVCRNHGWRYHTATGQREGGPQCLRTCPLREEGGLLLADVSALAAAGHGSGNGNVGGNGHGNGNGDGAARTRRAIAGLPGPRALPVVGNLPQLHPDRLHQILEAWVARYGPVFRFRFGRRLAVAVADATLIDEVLRSRPETYSRWGVVAPVFAELGISGVFSAEGAAWRPQRRLAMEALSQRHLRGFYPTLRAVALRLHRRLADSPPGSSIDIADDFRRFAVDVSMQLALGHDVDTLRREDDVMRGRLDQLFPTLNRRLLAVLPYWRVVRLPRDRRVERALAELRTWLGRLLEQARARLAADPERVPANFLEAMVVATDQDGRPFSDESIFGNTLQILVAGEDTTANTLAWAVHQLCDRPDAVARLRAEADAVLGDDVAAPDLDTVRRLAYAGAVAAETMRLRPVGPVIVHEAVQDTILGDIAIPRGTGVFLVMRPPARDPAHFAAPDEFRPERWLGEVSGAHDARAHMPFGSGPRICPGRSLALVELNLVLAMLYHAFDIERAPAVPGATARAATPPRDAVRERFSFTMLPVGLRVCVRERERSAGAVASVP